MTADTVAVETLAALATSRIVDIQLNVSPANACNFVLAQRHFRLLVSFPRAIIAKRLAKAMGGKT